MGLAVLFAVLVVSVPELVMHGPNNQEAVQSCGDECLCVSPAKPQPAYLINVASSQITVGFGKTSAAPFCDSASQVQMDSGMNEQWTTVYNGPHNVAVAVHLRSDETYRFRVRERNCAGLSAFSDLFSIKTLSQSAKPLPPVLANRTTSAICVRTNLTGVDLSESFNASQDVSISYREVGDDGSFSPSWEPVVANFNNFTRSWFVCVRELMSSTFYQFRVTIADPRLLNPVSETALYSTTAQAPPTPTKPLASAVDSKSFSISWSRVPSGKNRSPAAVYLVDCASLTEGMPVSGNATNPSASYPGLKFVRVVQTKKQTAVISGLEPGAPYAVRVIAVNDIGNSDPSPVLFVSTTPDVPSTPKLNFTFVSGDGIAVAWTVSNPRGSPVTKYTLEMFGGVNQEFTPVFDGLMTRKRMEAMEPNVYYGFRVRASNAVGSGNYSDQIFVKTPLPGQVLTEDQLLEASKQVPNVDRSRHSTLVQLQNRLEPSNLLSVEARHAARTTHSSKYTNADHESDNLSEMPPITVGSGSVNGSAEASPISADGRCSIDRGDCMEKDATISQKYFFCQATTQDASINPALDAGQCKTLNIMDLVSEGDSTTLGADAFSQLLEQRCSCACSGEDESCGETGVTRILGGATDASQCAQAICSFQKFSSCAWQGVMVSQGTWEADSITFTSYNLESSCLTQAAKDIDCPNSCGGFTHGRCLGNGTCACHGGWSGPDCLTATCPTRENECAPHGRCVLPDVCECDNGYSGPNCLTYAVYRFFGSETLNSTRFLRQPSALSHNDSQVWNEPASLTEGAHDSKKHHRALNGEVSSSHSKGTWITVPSFHGLDYSSNSSFTASLWFRATELSKNKDSAEMITHGNFRHEGGWGTGMIKGGYLYCAVGSTKSPFRALNLAMAVTVETFADDRFHHLSCVYDGHHKNIRLYVDGNAALLQQIWPYSGGIISKSQLGILHTSSLELSPSSPDSPLVIGASFSTNEGFFDGEMSEIRLWNEARPAELEAASMWSPLLVPSSNLLARFSLHENCESRHDGLLATVFDHANATYVETRVLFSPLDSHVPDCHYVAHPLAL